MVPYFFSSRLILSAFSTVLRLLTFLSTLFRLLFEGVCYNAQKYIREY
jgi:hypothetical protein